MKDFAERFYKSKRWQKNRDDYADSVGGLCESCAAQGLVVPGEIVHHRVELTPENINDPSISLSWKNLELVCRECHALRHPKGRQRRYIVDAQGRVTARDAPLFPKRGYLWETGEWGSEFLSHAGRGVPKWQGRPENSGLSPSITA